MLWVKALHVVAVISWMAGLVYLPRLFVYHADAEKGSVQSETFKTMERRLYRFIMGPAMGVSWIAGLWLAFGFALVDWNFSQGWGWVWAKAGFVILLSLYHLQLGRYLQAFSDDRNDKSSKFYRAINEIPTLLMIGIVIFVIVRPF